MPFTSMEHYKHFGFGLDKDMITKYENRLMYPYKIFSFVMIAKNSHFKHYTSGCQPCLNWYTLSNLSASCTPLPLH